MAHENLGIPWKDSLVIVSVTADFALVQFVFTGGQSKACYSSVVVGEQPYLMAILYPVLCLTREGNK